VVGFGEDGGGLARDFGSERETRPRLPEWRRWRRTAPGIYLDKGVTGTSRARPGLDLALAAVRSGDTLIVPKLDRLARSVPDIPCLYPSEAWPLGSVSPRPR